MLAAGSGTRMGGPKALLLWRGQTLAERAYRPLVAGGCAPVMIVIGGRASDVAAIPGLAAARFVRAEEWARGLSASVDAVLTAVSATEADAVVFTLVDQPLVGGEAVRRVVEAYRAGATVAVATYDGVPGHPVLSARAHWESIAASLTGDAGARKWLHTHRDLVSDVPVDATGHAFDVDTAADFSRLDELAERLFG